MSIKKKLINCIIGFTLIFSMIPIIANAKTKTVEVNEVKGKKYVSLTEITNAYEGTIVDKSDINVMIYKLNGKVVTVNSKTAFISIDNYLIPLETKKLNGIIVPSLDAEKISADNGEILIPVSIIENYFGIKCTDEGLNITITKADEKEEEEEALPTDDTDSYENTSDYYEDYYEDYYTETEEVYIEETKPTNENTSNNNTNNSSNNNDSSNNESSSNSGENSDDTSSGSSSNDEQATPQPEETPTTEQEPDASETPTSDQEDDSEETPIPEQEPDAEQTSNLKPEQKPNLEIPKSS